jgi:rRNA maturation endonuclease Nob1
MDGRDMLESSVIRSISAWAGEGLTTSFYLDLDGRSSPRWADVERRVGHLLRLARQRARALGALGSEGAASLEADLAEIERWLGRDIDRSKVRGVALFSCAAKGRFEALELPVPVRDQVVVDLEPDVAQLCLLASASWHGVAVGVDRERWRIVRFAQDGQDEEVDVVDDRLPHRIDVDIELAGFGHHDEELVRAHYRRVARAVEEELRLRPDARVVLCGPQESVRELEANLPRRAGARVEGRAHLELDTDEAALARCAREVLDAVDADRRSAAVAELRGHLATGDGAVAGIDASLAVLGAGQAASLFVERTFEMPGGRCESCGLLVAEAVGPCPRCGGHLRPVANVVDAAVGDAYLHDVALVALGDGELRDLGRIGALVAAWARAERLEEASRA